MGVNHVGQLTTVSSFSLQEASAVFASQIFLAGKTSKTPFFALRFTELALATQAKRRLVLFLFFGCYGRPWLSSLSQAVMRGKKEILINSGFLLFC